MVNHAELATDQFVRQIGIDAARIEQIDPVAQLLAMQLDDLEFSLRIAQLARIIAPGKHAIGAEDDIAGEEQQQQHRDM